MNHHYHSSIIQTREKSNQLLKFCYDSGKVSDEEQGFTGFNLDCPLTFHSKTCLGIRDTKEEWEELKL